MKIAAKHLTIAALAIVFLFGLSRAAQLRFRDKETQIQADVQKQRSAAGLTLGAAKAKYPTPEIESVTNGCLQPGATREVIAHGRFIPGTRFVLQNDNLEVVRESLTDTEYRFTVRVIGIAAPHAASLLAISPMSGSTAWFEDAVYVGGRYEWNMRGQNGWEIIARSKPGQDCPPNPEDRNRYDMTFARTTGGAPFERREGRLVTSGMDDYRFEIGSAAEPAGSPMQQLTELGKQLSDPNLSDARREELMTKLSQLQAGAAQSMAAMVANSQRGDDEFGCRSIILDVQNPNLKGEMACSRKVGDIPLTGTVRVLTR
jgi:hypothetical protein